MSGEGSRPLTAVRRADQLLSSLGYCSRREVQALCDEGRVTVAGVALEDGAVRVQPVAVRVDGEPLEFSDGLLVMFHKPVGLVCSHEARDGARIYDLLPERWSRRNPIVTSVGRLDKETSGLLLITDQGALIQRLTSPRHHVEKVYLAQLDREVPGELVQRFAQGLVLEGEREPTLPAELRLLGPQRAEVTLREGRYHQVRRMFAACGATVVALHRIRFGAWELGDLPPGEWRPLPLP